MIPNFAWNRAALRQPGAGSVARRRGPPSNGLINRLGNHSTDVLVSDIKEFLTENTPPEDLALLSTWKADSLEIGVDQLQRLLDRYYSSKDGMATRAGVIIGAAAATLAVTFDIASRETGMSLAFVEIGGVLATACLVLAIVGYAMTDWDFVPDPTVFAKLIAEEKDYVQRRLILALRNACVDNAASLNRGKWVVNISLVALASALTFSALAVFA